MQPRRRSPMLFLAALAASLCALALAGSAMAATQTTGPYQVTDEITHDGSGDTATTTATYTITVPDEPGSDLLAATGAVPFVQAISHVDVGVCNDLADRTYDIQRDTGSGPSSFGSFKVGGDARERRAASFRRPPRLRPRTPAVRDRDRLAEPDLLADSDGGRDVLRGE